MAKKPTPRTKGEIITALAEVGSISKKQAGEIYEALLEITYAGSQDPKGFTLPGLGKFIKEDRPARKGRNPATNEEIMIKARTVVKFRLSKAASDAILGNVK